MSSGTLLARIDFIGEKMDSLDIIGEII